METRKRREFMGFRFVFRIVIRSAREAHFANRYGIGKNVRRRVGTGSENYFGT